MSGAGAVQARSPRPQAKPRTQLVNIGIIGFGRMGRIRYQTIMEHRLGRVVACFDPAEEAKLPAGLCRYRSAEAVIADSEVEAIFICTPNCFNQPLTIEALQAGKHVFCEKPPALCAREVEAVQAAERASGKKVMYGFNHRHHDSIKKAKALVESGVYGRLLWMRGRYGKSVDQTFYKNWRAHKTLSGGGILIDQGIHMLDLFLMLAGDFDEVHAFVSNLYWKLEVEDNVFAILRNRDGVAASLHSTMTQWRHLFSFEIFLEKGYIVINGLLTSSGSYGEEVMTIAKNRTTAPAATWDDEEHLRFEVNNSWRYEVEQFIEAIRTDGPVMVGNSEDALKLMRVIDRIYQKS